MSAVPERRSRAEAQQETRERLLEAAAVELAEHGLNGASIDAITSRAGFTRGAFYSNFDDKSELLLELVERRVGAFVEDRLGRLLATPRTERAAALAHWLVTEDESREVLLLAELARLAPSVPAAAEALTGVLDAIARAIADALARAAAVDASDAATAFGAVPGGVGDAAPSVDDDRVVALAIATLGTQLMRAMRGSLAVEPVALLLGALLDAASAGGASMAAGAAGADRDGARS